ncbi:hypothetical protein [Sulfuriflexus mobilis]|uniref:hypothetical protein n=1 Tax=Sulfuriflexus mobilis TaxID=1811807 RepID=UPI000F8443B1|nr:hypothetical protein [Sulfuriflexus mobilis]
MSLVDTIVSNIGINDVVTILLAVIPWKLQAFYTQRKLLELIHQLSALPPFWLKNGPLLYSMVRWIGFFIFIAAAIISEWNPIITGIAIILIYFLATDVGKNKAYEYWVSTAEGLLAYDEELTDEEREEYKNNKEITYSEFKAMVKLFKSSK